MPNDTISPTLLERIRAHDNRAWDRLLRLFGPLVRSWVRRAGVRDGDLDDVVQDVFLKVSKSLDGFRRDRPGDTFLGWLRTIVRQRAADYHTHKGESPAGGTLALAFLQELPESTDADSIDPDARATLVQRTLEMLREEFEAPTWEAFQATAVENRRADEVAAKLGMSVGAVYVAKSRVLKRLRDELDGLFELPTV